MNWKKILQWILIIFFIYAIFVSPEKAADIIGNIWGVIVDGVNAILRFFDALLGRA